MRIRTFQHDSPAGKINVTPLIDVVMVLIVFYLIVGRLAAERAVRVNLPEAIAGEASAPDGVVIALARGDDGSQRILVQGTEVTIESLLSTLQAQIPELASGDPQITPVHLRADRTFTFGQVQPVIEVCRQAGLSNLKLVSTRASREGGS